MSWYYTSATGNVFQATGASKFTIDRSIFVQKHDLVPGQLVYGPFGTEAQAQAAAGVHPPISLSSTVSALNPVAGVTADIAGYFVRAAEIILGVVLIAIALNAILKETTGVNVAGKIAHAGVKAGEVAAVA